MFFAWSPMRSKAFATHITCIAVPMVRGSSIMNVMSWRRIPRNSSSIAWSSAITRAAAAASRRASASSARRSMPSAVSERWLIAANLGPFERLRTGPGRGGWPELSFAVRAIFVASSPMRSRSVTILLAARIRRRSEAAGWRRTMMCPRSLSIATSSSFTLASAAITCIALSMSPSRYPAIARRMCDSTSPPICSMLVRIASRSSSYCLLVCSVTGISPRIPIIYPFCDSRVTASAGRSRGSTTRRPEGVERRAGRDRLRVDAHLDHGGLLRSERALHRRAELRRVLDDLADRPERARERGEMRVLQVGADHAPRVVLLLVHADRAVHAVVDDDEDRGRVVLHGGREPGSRHEEVAVACEAHDRASGLDELRGDRRRDAIAHRARGRRELRA